MSAIEHTGGALAGVADPYDPSGAIAEARDRLTRRGLLAAAAAGASALTLGGPAAVRAQSTAAADVAILNYALVLEYLQAAFYTEAERMGALRGSLAQQATVVGAHERAHVAAFRQVLGAQAVGEPTFNFRGVTEDPDTFRRTAVAFEDLAVAAYKYQLPHIASPQYLQAAVDIHSVEARHAAWIRYLAGVQPAADAFDEPLAPDRVLSLVSSTHFVVSPARTASRGRRPHFTG